MSLVLRKEIACNKVPKPINHIYMLTSTIIRWHQKEAARALAPVVVAAMVLVVQKDVMAARPTTTASIKLRIEVPHPFTHHGVGHRPLITSLHLRLLSRRLPRKTLLLMPIRLWLHAKIVGRLSLLFGDETNRVILFAMPAVSFYPLSIPQDIC